MIFNEDISYYNNASRYFFRYNVIANRICQLDIMIHKYIIRWNIRKSAVNIGGTRNVRI